MRHPGRRQASVWFERLGELVYGQNRGRSGRHDGGGGAISLEEFKARLPIAEVVGRHVRLTRRGRELTGLCPFHKEKTPSFTVSEGKGFFHCFGCGQHGNAIDFVMALEGLSFPEALAKLGEVSGLPVPLGGSGRPPVDRTLFAANEAAARWFAGRLEGAEGAAARSYLEQRGLDAETTRSFGLGYAPRSGTALGAALQAEGFSDDQLVDVGLRIRPEDGRPPYDRFRDRLMFPITDQRGRPVGFGGRALGEATAKYLNTAETELFHKGELLYGYDRAQPMARSQGTVVVVEGYMDVLALARVGLAHAVAPLGTAITEHQLRWLWQLAQAPLICLDGDAAGLRAAHRLIERALPLLQPGHSLRFVVLPAGEDPDSLIRQQGRSAIEARLSESIHFIDFLWRAETAGQDLRAPERRAALDRRLRELGRMIQDPDLRRRFNEAMFKRLRTVDGPFKGGRRSGGRPGPDRRPTEPPWRQAEAGVGAARLAASLRQEPRLRERELIIPILVRPEILAEVEEEFANLVFEDPELELMRDCITAWYGDHGHLDPSGLNAHLNATGWSSLFERLVAAGVSHVPPTDGGGGLSGVVESWRARIARHRLFAERRALVQAAAEAIGGPDEREMRARLLAVDRLINPEGRDGRRTGGEGA